MWLFQGLCMAGVVASLYLLTRWRMTWFVYGIRLRGDSTPFWEGEMPAYAGGNPTWYTPPERLDFLVIKGQGSRSGAMECLLGLDTLVEACPVSRKEDGSGREVYDRRDWQNRYPGAKVYTYLQTFGWQEAFAIVFRDGEDYAILLLDLPESDELARYLLSLTPPTGQET